MPGRARGRIGRVRLVGPPVFRFAPSPNGRLHLGHAYSALLNERFRRELGGRFLLRIEDVDPIRSRPELVEAIFDDLRWLGLRWEEPVRRQSEHMDEYRAAAARLRARGLIYPCLCTRGEVREAAAAKAAAARRPVLRDPDGAPLYPGTCRESAAALGRSREEQREPAWRLHTARALAEVSGPLDWTAFDGDGRGCRREAEPLRWGDPVVVRRDVPTSYHLSVVLDDALQGVTHVVRGRDLEAATDLHVLLQALLGLPSPRYHHHRLIRDRAGAKLSKSLGSPALADLRSAGATPSDIRRRLGFTA